MADDTNNANESKDQPVTITAPPNAAVTIDPQNPLPEASFFWRRIMTMGVAAVLLGLDWYLAVKIHDLGGASDNLLTLAKWNIVLNAAVLTYYFIAPSAAELVNLIQSASIIKHSLTTAAQTAVGSQGLGLGAPKPPSPAPDSQIPASGPGEAPRGLSGDLGDSAEVDAAPRG